MCRFSPLEEQGASRRTIVKILYNKIDKNSRDENIKDLKGKL